MKTAAIIAITIFVSFPVIAANSDGGGLGGTGQGNQSSSSGGGGGHNARTRAGVNVQPVEDALIGGAKLAYGLLTGTAGPGASGGGVRAAEGCGCNVGPGGTIGGGV